MPASQWKGLAVILKAIGALTIVVVVVVLLLVLYLRSKWKRFVTSFAEAVENPSEVHLTEDIAPDWYDEEDLQEIRAAGFTIGPAYLIQEMEGVCLLSLFHQETGITGVLYEHPAAGKWYDLFVETGGREITVSSAPKGEEIDTRPECTKLFRSGAPLEQLLTEMCDRIQARPITAISAETFRDEFEAAYRRDMEWRNSRGGVTEEEVRRVAANMSEDFDENALSQGFLETKSQELDRWHDEGLTELRRSAAFFQAEEEDRYFFVAEAFHPEVFVDYLADFVTLNDKQIADFKNLVSEDLSLTELYGRIVGCFSPSMRPTVIGEITHPIPAKVYLAPM